MTDLYVLKGPNSNFPAHISDSDSFIHWFLSLPNKEAGAVILQTIGESFPGITLNDFTPQHWPTTKAIMEKASGLRLSGHCEDCYPVNMSGPCEGFVACFGSFVTDTTGLVSRTSNDSVNFLADKGGDFIRLLTDEEVIGGVTEGVAMWYSGGASAGYSSLLDGVGSTSKEAAAADSGVPTGSDPAIDKAAMGEWGVDNKYLVWGGVGVFLLIATVGIASAVGAKKKK